MAKDTLENALGTGVEIELAGKNYKLSPFTVADYLALKSDMRRRRISDFRKSCEDNPLPDKERLAIIRQLASEEIGDQEVVFDAQNLDGMLFLLWRGLSKNDPSIKLEDMPDLVGANDLHDLMAVADSLSAGAAEGEQGANPPSQAPAKDTDGTS